jgi:3-oxoacyl-[acyl-carrier-protein] synthase II
VSKRRVVVTGLGTVNPLSGNTVDTWEKLVAGQNGIDYITLFDTAEHKSKIGGEVKNLDTSEFNNKELKQLDRYAQLSLIAAKEAVEDSKFIHSENFDPYLSGCITGVGMGGLRTVQDQCEVLTVKGPKRISPFTIPMMLPNIAALHIAAKHNLKGINFTCSSACASGNHALGTAFRSIQYGDADIIVSGGVESCINPISVAAFSNMKALSRSMDPKNASRPFDMDRDGFVIAEGAGFLVLEEYEHAVARSAKIYAEIVGYGATSDAYHVTAPDPEGEAGVKAFQLAIKDAGITPSDIQYISAHGTSTHLNDKIETLIISKVFGGGSKNISINSTKSMIGHSLGAAAGIEALVCCKTIETGIIHPTINLKNPAPDCYLDYTPGSAVKRNVKYALSNSLGFGGHNGVLVFKKINTHF